MEQYSGSVGYANRVTTSGAQNGTDHVCIILYHFFLMQRLQGLQILDGSTLPVFEMSPRLHVLPQVSFVMTYGVLVPSK